MNNTFTLFKLKLIEYFSSIRKTKIAAFFLFWMMISIIFFGYTLGISYKEYVSAIINASDNTMPIDIEYYGRMEFVYDLSTLVLSLVFLGTLLFSLKTAYTATEADIDFIFSLPIKFREYATAEALYQVIILNIVYLAFLSYSSSILVTMDPVLLFWLIILFELFVFIMVIYGQILYILYRKTQFLTTLILIIIAVLSLLPVIELLGLSIDYLSILFPTYIIIDVLYSANMKFIYIPVMIVYIIIGLLPWYRLTNENYFPKLEPTTIGVFGGFSERKLRPVLGLKYKFWREVIKVDTEGTLFKAHLTKELARIVRDGTLLNLFLISLIYSVIIFLMILKGEFKSELDYVMAIGGSTVFFVIFSPSIIIERWRLTDKKNLWILIASDSDYGEYIKALVFNTAVISLLIPLVIIMIMSIYISLIYIIIYAILFITLAVLTTLFTYGLEFRYGKATYDSFSADYMMIILASYILAAIFASPNIVILFIIELFHPSFFIPIVLIYDLIIIYLIYRWVCRQFKHIRTP